MFKEKNEVDHLWFNREVDTQEMRRRQQKLYQDELLAQIAAKNKYQKNDDFSNPSSLNRPFNANPNYYIGTRSTNNNSSSGNNNNSASPGVSPTFSPYSSTHSSFVQSDYSRTVQNRNSTFASSLISQLNSQASTAPVAIPSPTLPANSTPVNTANQYFDPASFQIPTAPPQLRSRGPIVQSRLNQVSMAGTESVRAEIQ